MAVATEQETVSSVSQGAAERFFERAALVMLGVFVLAAPHSIAVTQGAFIGGTLFWICRMAAARKIALCRTPIDLPLLFFIVWTVLSVFASIDLANSVARLRGVSLFIIMYLFASNVRAPRVAWLLTLLLAFSVLGNLWWTYYDKARGRGVEIVSMTADSPLRQWGLVEGDAILAVDGRPVSTVREIHAAFDGGEKRDLVTIRFRRVEGELDGIYRRGRVQRSGDGPERLGIEGSPGRNFRSRGYFSHPATYAETLQMIVAICAGWVIVAARRNGRWAIGMGALGLLVAGALIQTETRAPLVGFAVAMLAMVAVSGASRKFILAALLAMVVFVAAGGVVIMQGRRVGFLDPNDGSTTWRLTVWREAASLIAEHPLLGIGPDGAKRRAQELGLFDDGKLPPGHFHSTPIQLAVDRGLPALIAWIVMMAVFFVSAGRFARGVAAASRAEGDWRFAAAMLGSWGAIVGFAVSSFVHLNWMDSEAMQMAWALMGICFAGMAMSRREEPGDELR